MSGSAVLHGRQLVVSALRRGGAPDANAAYEESLMRRTTTSILSVIAAVVLVLPGLARAAEEGPFGLGISAGEPTGISAKYFFSENAAMDATVDRFTPPEASNSTCGACSLR